MTTRADIVAEAKAWRGIRWHHQGYSKVGCDCFGLVMGIGLACGISEAREWETGPLEFRAYQRQPDARLLLTACARFFDPADRDSIRLADILILGFGRDPMHFSIVSALGPLYVIHALSRPGRVVEHRIDPTWNARIMRAYRFRGVE